MCLKVTLPAPPSLGGGLSIAPPSLPAFSGSLDVCCKSIPWATPTYVPPFTAAVFNPAVALALSAAIGLVQDYINGLLPDCPLE